MQRRRWLAAMLAALACTYSLNPAIAQIEVEQKRLTLEEKLDKPISIDDRIAAKTPLKDVLEFLSDRFDMTIRIDSAGFKKQLRIDDIDNAPVHLPRLSRMRLGLVLALLAKQASGSYEIRPDYIEI